MLIVFSDIQQMQILTSSKQHHILTARTQETESVKRSNWKKMVKNNKSEQTTAKAKKSKVYICFDPGVFKAFKAKAERVGIPYQTLLNSIVKRYTEGKLDIEPN